MRIRRLGGAASLIFCLALGMALAEQSGWATTFYLSPTGDNSKDGKSTANAWQTFAKAFGTSGMAGGDTLILLNGTYTKDITGYINSSNAGCPKCAQPPNGGSTSAMTIIKAQNPGNVTIQGEALDNRDALFLGTIGTSSGKKSFIRIEGILFKIGAAHLYNTDHIYIKNCGFFSAQQKESVIGIGTNDGDWGNTNILIEDSWGWGPERKNLNI